LTYAVRRAFIERVAPQYWQASWVQKSLLLDTVVATTNSRGLFRKSKKANVHGLLLLSAPGVQKSSSETEKG
jgi:hypothetical protein